MRPFADPLPPGVVVAVFPRGREQSDRAPTQAVRPRPGVELRLMPRPPSEAPLLGIEELGRTTYRSRSPAKYRAGSSEPVGYRFELGERVFAAPVAPVDACHTLSPTRIGGLLRLSPCNLYEHPSTHPAPLTRFHDRRLQVAASRPRPVCAPAPTSNPTTTTPIPPQPRRSTGCSTHPSLADPPLSPDPQRHPAPFRHTTLRWNRWTRRDRPRVPVRRTPANTHYINTKLD